MVQSTHLSACSAALFRFVVGMGGILLGCSLCGTSSELRVDSKGLARYSFSIGIRRYLFSPSPALLRNQVLHSPHRIPCFQLQRRAQNVFSRFQFESGARFKADHRFRVVGPHWV